MFFETRSFIDECTDRLVCPPEVFISILIEVPPYVIEAMRELMSNNCTETSVVTGSEFTKGKSRILVHNLNSGGLTQSQVGRKEIGESHKE